MMDLSSTHQLGGACIWISPNRIASLQENDIGQELSLFYIAYASYVELKGSFDRAEALYQAGLQRYDRHSSQGTRLVIPASFEKIESAVLQRAVSIDCALGIVRTCCRELYVPQGYDVCRMAVPVEKLRVKHEDFKERMVS